MGPITKAKADANSRSSPVSTCRDRDARRVRDLSELLARERRARRVLAARLVVMNNVVAATSDSARVALNVVADWVRLLSRSHLDGRSREAAITAMERIVRKHVDRVDEIIAIGPHDGERVHLRVDEHDFGDLVRSASMRFRQEHDRIDIEENVLSDGPSVVVADRVRLERAIEHLLRVAVRRSPERARLRLVRRRELRAVTLRIDHALADAADDEEAETLWSIANTIIDAHRGQLDVVDDDVTQVRSVHVRLPSIVDDAPALDGARVLIVHEDDVTSDLVAALVRASGGSTLCSRDTSVAMRAIVAFAPDVVLSVGLPHARGVVDTDNRLRRAAAETRSAFVTVCLPCSSTQLTTAIMQALAVREGNVSGETHTSNRTTA